MKLIFNVTADEFAQLTTLVQANASLTAKIKRAEFEYLVREDVKAKANARKAVVAPVACELPVTTETKTA
jgi:hypothetical protein